MYCVGYLSLLCTVFGVAVLARQPTVPNYSYAPYDFDYNYSGQDSNYDNYDLNQLENLMYKFLSSSQQTAASADMSSAARISSHPYSAYGYGEYPSTQKMGYQQMMTYGYQQPQQMQSYGHQMVQQKPQKGYMQQQPSGYGMEDHKGYEEEEEEEDDDYGHKMPRYKPKKKKRKQVKKVFVPIVIRKKKQKKRKTIAVFKGFYIQGGTQIFGKFKKIKDCKKACEITPNCFAADYNPWLKKCYIHTNVSACEEMRTHPKLIHFKKVPCDLLETPRGLITLGVRIFGGLEQKGVKNLQDCIKKCATSGSGIAPDSMPLNLAKQICFGIDYDFASHKCYFHTNELLCPAVDPIPTPVQVVEAPSVINILLCPLTSVTA